MDITKIKRRERRFYRKEEDGDIEYSDTPVKKPTQETTTTSIPIDTTKKLTTSEKQQIIDKILKDMKSSINPDIDEIADMIYSQLSIKDTNLTHETVKQVVQNNAHYRSSRGDRAAGTETTRSTTEGIKDNYDFLNDRKELGLVIDDIVEENQKEDIRAKDKKDKEKAAARETAVGSEKESKHRRANSEKPVEKKKEIISEKPKPEKKKEELKLDFGDDEDTASEKEDSTEEDELGLKF